MTNARLTFTSLDRNERGRVWRIAHRGASAYAPENSLVAFQKAAEMGADAVEVDLQITADEHPVIAHDDNLRRLYGNDAAISDLSLEQLRRLIPADREPIPTFAEVAEVCADLKLGLYLDIKRLSITAAQAVLATLGHTNLKPYTIFGSFRPDFLAELKAHAPDLHTSILFSSTHLRPTLLAQAVAANFVHPCWENAAPAPHQLLTEAWIAEVRQAGLGIVCWHEERPSEIAALSALGVDAICSDTPDILTQYT